MKTNKKKYEKPTLRIISHQASPILAASGGNNRLDAYDDYYDEEQL